MDLINLILIPLRSITDTRLPMPTGGRTGKKGWKSPTPFRDEELIETLQELYLSLGYFDIHGQFPKPTSGVSLFCGNLNPGADKEHCEGCSLEKVTFEDESFCFYGACRWNRTWASHEKTNKRFRKNN